ncbi:MAG TPA: protein TolQ [Gammaproteobacteria bacterium]|nr:protein TolQ [Gammaproteobacteria bacterium]HPI95379.1 protein TolQ [Gammaproteobacteria bacterium]HPQ87191.1 protein TolQ [Gammaproteobacteria bacterium]
MNQDFNFIELVMNASLPVKGVMLLLVMAVVASWWIIFAKWMSLKQASISAKKFEETFWSGVDLHRLYEKLSKEKGKSSGMEQIFEAGFREFLRTRKMSQSDAKATESADRSMRIALNREIDVLESHLPFLATIGSISPYIGLFGTVIGIMISFHALSNVTQATIALVAPGISEALIATAMGLFAAIPAVVFYNKFNAKVERLYNQYDIFKEEFSSILHRQTGS